jgi:hypothetical protein
VSKIHWSTQTFPEFACEKKRRQYRLTDARHNSRVSAGEFVAKHAECPNVFCAKCARIANEHSRVVFTAAEVEHLRALLEYVGCSYVAPEARKGVDVLKQKVGHD